MADPITTPAAAPKGARKTTLPEPTFSDAGGGPTGPNDVMDVNPTPRAPRDPEAADPSRQYIPDPFGGKSGPAHLAGEDLARAGGGPDQRIDKRQNDLAEKYRNDPAVKKLMHDETKKKFGVLPDAPEVSPEDARAAAGDEPAADDPNKPTDSAAEVAQIARLEREKRELRDRLKQADGARTSAKRLEMYQKIAEDYPIAAVRGLFGDDFVDKLYADDVAGKSKAIGDKYKSLDPSKELEADDAVAGVKGELERERQRAAELQAQLAERNLRDQVSDIARSDGKRWELCLREPNIGAKVAEKARAMYRDAKPDEKAGLQRIWQDDKMSAEFTAGLLDDLEKEFDGVGKRFSRGPAPASAPAARRPSPPANQRAVVPGSARPGQEHDRYARPPKRQSVEDRQDAMVARYAGVKYNED